MGLARLLSFVRTRANSAQVSDVKVDPGGGANVTAQHFAPAGDDSHPLPGDYVALTGASGTGRANAVGYIDPANEQKAAAGEKRVYARSADGAPMVEVWLKNDGSAIIQNSAGVFTLQPDGEFNINGARITTGGDVITAAGVSLNNHPHSQGVDSDNNSQAATNPPTPTE